MPEPFPDRSKHKLQGRAITFGLREAAILAIVATTIACVIVYYNVT